MSRQSCFTIFYKNFLHYSASFSKKNILNPVYTCFYKSFICNMSNAECHVNMKKRVLFIFIVNSSLINFSCTSSCSTTDDNHCHKEELEDVENDAAGSFMLKAANEIISDENMENTIKSEQLPSDSNSTIQNNLENDVKLEGELEPCLKKESDGQLQRSLILSGGYRLQK